MKKGKAGTTSVRPARAPSLIVCSFLTPLLGLGAETEPAGPQSATHKEVQPIGAEGELRFGSLSAFTMTPEGNLLACDPKTEEIKVVDPAGKLLATWKPGFAPHAIHSCRCGEVFVAGHGVVAKLDKTGKLLKTAKAGAVGFPDAKASGISVWEANVFVAFGTQWSRRSRSTIARFDRDLSQATTIAKDLRGCCQRLDMAARDGALYVAENARHRVIKYDPNGKVLLKWGSRDRKNIEGFGSCCNPMNLCFGPGGELYTAESGLGRVKRYTAEGKYLGLVGYVGVERFNRAGRLAASCSNITVAVNKDGSRVYVLDFKNSLIRVLAEDKKGPEQSSADAASDG